MKHNPFIVLRRLSAENAGEVMGFSLIYSGNHRMQAEVDTHDTTRITVESIRRILTGKLDCGESFQTPEAVVVFSDKGLNGMSQTFHKLYQKRLARGYWRDRPKPQSLTITGKLLILILQRTVWWKLLQRQRNVVLNYLCWMTDGSVHEATIMQDLVTGWQTESVFRRESGNRRQD